MEVRIIKGGLNSMPKNKDNFQSGLAYRFPHSMGYDKMIEKLISVAKISIERERFMGIGIDWDKEIEVTNKNVCHKPHSRWDWASITFRLKNHS